MGSWHTLRDAADVARWLAEHRATAYVPGLRCWEGHDLIFADLLWKNAFLSAEVVRRGLSIAGELLEADYQFSLAEKAG